MPDQWERHGKTDEWGYRQPSRSQQRDAAAHDDPTRNKPKSHRDPALCKHNHWQPHRRVMTYSRWRGQCGWKKLWRRAEYVPYFACGHHWQCQDCGKHLGYVAAKDCPLWHPEPAGLKEECDKLTADKPNFGRYRPTYIKGPSHYRKPKAT